MSNYPHEPGPPGQSARQAAVQKFFRGPGLIVVAFTLALVVWWLISFLTPEPVHKGGPINYSGVAEVMDVAEGPRKCHVYIKRDTGKETRQTMARASCRKMRVGDMINVENGQYVSTIPNPYR